MGGFFWLILLGFTSVMMYLLWKLLEFKINPESYPSELDVVDSIRDVKRSESVPYTSPIPFFTVGGGVYPHQEQAPLSGHPDIHRKLSHFSILRPSNYSLKRMSNYSFAKGKMDDYPYRNIADFTGMNRTVPAYPVASRTMIDYDYIQSMRSESDYRGASRSNYPVITRSMADYPMNQRGMANYAVGNKNMADYSIGNKYVGDYPVGNRNVPDYPMFNKSMDYTMHNRSMMEYPVNARSMAEYSIDSRPPAYPSSSRSTAFAGGSRNPVVPGHVPSSRPSQVRIQTAPSIRTIAKSVSSPSVKIN